jgi:serine protease inhibitor
MRHASALRLVPHMLVAAFVAVGSAGCDWITGSDDPVGPPPEITELPRPLTIAEEAVIRGSTSFGLGLLREVVRDEPGETHLLSPFSASMALGMALNGADGATFDEMRETLGFADRGAEALDLAAINESYRDLVELLLSVDPAVSFSVANAVWHDQPWTPRSAFVQSMDAYFSAPVRGVDFRAPGTPDLIDAWVQDATRGRIDGIAPRPIPADAVAYLVNALHFLGDWRQSFDPSRTQDHQFRADDGSTTPIRMMTRQGKIRSSTWQGHTAVDLPYGGAAWSMTLVLPRSDVGLSGLVEELDAEGWAELTSSFSEMQGMLGVPRFTAEWSGRLVDPLARMGMPSLFDEARADLSLLFEEDARLFVSDVRQKTWMRVDEKGTEAAAVTSVEVGVTSAPPSIYFDRPFLLAIRERHSGTILFLGAFFEAPVGG